MNKTRKNKMLKNKKLSSAQADDFYQKENHYRKKYETNIVLENNFSDVSADEIMRKVKFICGSPEFKPNSTVYLFISITENSKIFVTNHHENIHESFILVCSHLKQQNFCVPDDALLALSDAIRKWILKSVNS